MRSLNHGSGGWKKEICTFSTMTKDLLKLSDELVDTILGIAGGTAEVIVSEIGRIILTNNERKV